MTWRESGQDAPGPTSGLGAQGQPSAHAREPGADDAAGANASADAGSGGADAGGGSAGTAAADDVARLLAELRTLLRDSATGAEQWLRAHETTGMDRASCPLCGVLTASRWGLSDLAELAIDLLRALRQAVCPQQHEEAERGSDAGVDESPHASATSKVEHIAVHRVPGSVCHEPETSTAERENGTRC